MLLLIESSPRAEHSFLDKLGLWIGGESRNIFSISKWTFLVKVIRAGLVVMGANRDLGLKFVDTSITVLGGTVDVGGVAALGKLYI